MKAISIVVTISILNALPAAQAQVFEEGDYLYAMPVNPVSEPWKITEEIGKCMNENPACRVVVEAAGTYVGIPPGTIDQMIDAANDLGVKTTSRHQGEEFWQRFDQPTGYLICNVYVSTISAAPDTGDYSPYFSIKADRKRISVYNFVHKLKVGEGKSWYDGVVSVHLRKSSGMDYSACNMQVGVDKQAEYSCKGAKGTNGGYPSCTTKPTLLSP